MHGLSDVVHYDIVCTARNINHCSVGDRRSSKGVEKICDVVRRDGCIGNLQRRLRRVRDVDHRGESDVLLVGWLEVE